MEEVKTNAPTRPPGAAPVPAQRADSIEAIKYLEAGRNKFNALLITLSHDSLEDWSYSLLDELTPYVDGLQACFYMTDEDDEGETLLRLLSVYGSKKQDAPQTFRLGEGISGQAVKSNKTYYLTNPEALSARSFTSLTVVQPKALLVMPLAYKKNVEGVLEITSRAGFSDEQFELLKMLSETVAANLANIKGQKKITRLYAEAQQKTRLLEEKESKLRGYITDLEKTQNEMRRLQDNLEITVRERTSELEKALTELQDAQQQIVQSEKLASLGQLVAGVAHEINTPIGIAVTAASYLDASADEFEGNFLAGKIKKSDLTEFLKQARESSSLILKNLERAAQLIQSFKRVAVNQASEDVHDFNLKTYLEEVLTSLRPQFKRTKVTYEIDCPDDIEMISSSSAVSQIVINLVMNSLIHGFDKGAIEGKITIMCRRQGAGRVVIDYKDNGKGIPQDVIPKIFDPFFTTRRSDGGSGLGLNIVHNLVVQSLKGKLECESVVGEGTTFILDLPLNAGD